MASPEITAQADASALGLAVRRTRTRLGLSVEALAEESGVSMGQISQLERGKANPSLKTLDKVAQAMGVSIVSLLSAPRPDGVTLVRKDQRTELPLADQPPGYRRELLTPPAMTGLQVIRTVLPAGYSNHDSPYRHLGYESVTVLAGRLTVVVAGNAVTVAVGDTINYECSRPHYWANDFDGETVVLGSVIPVAP